MNKSLVIYHANCTDGFSAAWVFHRYVTTLGDVVNQTFDFYPANYNGAPPEIAGYGIVYLVDFSYSRLVMGSLIASYPDTKFVLIDHHATAIKDLEGLAGLQQFVDIERSGARLAWDYLFPGAEAPRMIDYVQDRDLWQFKLPMSKETSAYIGSLSFSFEAWDSLMLGGDDIIKHARWAAQGEALLRRQTKLVEEIARGAILGDFAGYSGIPICNCPGAFASDVGNVLAQKAPFSVTFHFAHTKLLVSLRSRDDGGSDVGRIAQAFGGGGHKHSAGFSLSDAKLDEAFCWWVDPCRQSAAKLSGGM